MHGKCNVKFSYKVVEDIVVYSVSLKLYRPKIFAVPLDYLQQ
jgi:hypothetical protein